MGPIEPAAITAATLLASKALEGLGGKAGEATWAGMGRLVEVVHRKLTGDPRAASTLEQVERHPDDVDYIRDLAGALAAVAADDDAFRRELLALVADARRNPAVGALATKVYGHAQIDRLITVGQARDVYVQPAPPAPPAPPAAAPPTAMEVHWPAPGRTVANLPPRNLAFTGRDDLLCALGERLTAGAAAAVVQPQALHGLGGVGKTQLALEYAHRCSDDYDVIWWIAAELPATIPDQLIGLARRLGLAESVAQAETIQALWDELRGRDRWLLVFDNAEDPRDLRPFWPPASGHVLVTSRTPVWTGLATALPVDVLPRPEAITFLRRRLGRHDPAFGRLADALGDLPLALDQAAAYLEETVIGVKEYLDLLGERAQELFALGRPTTTQQTIATIWTVALGRLREQTPIAEDLLVLYAFLAPDDIPRALPAQYPEVLPERLARTVRDPVAHHQVIAALRSVALITASDDGRSLSMHRLVRAVVRHHLPPDQHQHWAAVALRLLREAFPSDYTNPDAWPRYAGLLRHALATADRADALGVEPHATAWLLNQCGLYLRQRADHKHARAVLERAVDIFQTRSGVDHPDTAWSLSNLATVLREQGDPHTARTLHERALRIREARLGPDHPDTAVSLTDLANVLHDQGDLHTARTLHERALQIFEASLGPDHALTARTLHSLGRALYEGGDLETARVLFERAWSIRMATLGPDHPPTVWSLGQLANVLRDQGDLETARTLHERALRIREARLGPDHPDTALGLSNLANVLRAQGDLDSARTHLGRALRIFEASLGSDHPSTTQARTDLAAIEAAHGRSQ